MYLCDLGALTGRTNSCIIREVFVTGNINVSNVSDYNEGNYIGGLISWNGGSDVTYCCVDSPEGSVKGNNYVGGLFGYSRDCLTGSKKASPFCGVIGERW